MLVFKVHFGIRCRLQPPSTRFRNLVDILDKYEKIDFMSLTEADQKGMLDVIPAPLRYESFHLVFPNGEAKSGSEALL
jgi:hypothetical protein